MAISKGLDKRRMEKYTVIIPTRDRVETLEPTLRTCLRQTYKNFEIIVSDNFSADNTKEIVDRFADPRIRYINPGRRLSMSGNFEFALSHVSDGFVMFIGSDDGIMPDAIEYVDSIVRRYGVDAVSCRQATYVWLNFPDKDIAGQMTFGGWHDDVEMRKSSEWIKKTLKFQVPYCFDLPNLYCGFVHKRVIDKAYKEGKYFRSITPDAYSAFATAIFIDKYAFSHKPFSIAGASAKSNGASAMHPAGDSGEANKFYSENDIDFCEGFVNCPSYEIVAGEAFAKLAQAFPELCAPYNIDYTSMLHGALENSNEKTEKAIRSAVAAMAANFAVKIETSPRRHTSGASSVKLNNAFRALRKMIAPEKVIAVQRSEDIGVRNIDDAALVAHVLSQHRTDKTFTTSRSLIKQRLKQLIGL
jgi:glycosyltransferase involved in cell wall biosynthesis